MERIFLTLYLKKKYIKALLEILIAPADIFVAMSSIINFSWILLYVQIVPWILENVLISFS